MQKNFYWGYTPWWNSKFRGHVYWREWWSCKKTKEELRVIWDRLKDDGCRGCWGPLDHPPGWEGPSPAAVPVSGSNAPRDDQWEPGQGLFYAVWSTAHGPSPNMVSSLAALVTCLKKGYYWFNGQDWGGGYFACFSLTQHRSSSISEVKGITCRLVDFAIFFSSRSWRNPNYIQLFS